MFSQLPINRTQWTHKIIQNYVNILNRFYATDLDVYHMAANYYTSVPSNLMYTSDSSAPVNFFVILPKHAHQSAHKRTKCARLRWARQGEADSRRFSRWNSILSLPAQSA
jgi:hypothetical protein